MSRRPKAPSAVDDFAAIRRRRDELRDEPKPPPKDDPMSPMTTGIFLFDYDEETFKSCGLDYSEGEE